MRKHIYSCLGVTILTLLLSSCSDERASVYVRSVYYWSTVFNIDSTKASFLKEHRVSKLYVRYFDVVVNGKGQLMPNATISLPTQGIPVDSAIIAEEANTSDEQSAKVLQEMEIVPCIYIVNECLDHDISQLADKLFKRVMQMNETHDVKNVKEIQIDCDWTMRTQEKYFNFLEQLRKMAHSKGLTLSVTIRLHQLSIKVPPADRGVLMMYNTGDFTDIRAEKPILDMRDAQPFMRFLSSYKLPLATAYPLYRWRIAFREGRYVGIIHADDDLPLLEGDSIVVRQPTMEDIMSAKKAVNKQKAEANEEIILFDLNNSNITRFKPKEYEEIYSH